MQCAKCNDAQSWCDACGGTSSREATLGHAGARGRYWAADVARLAPSRRGEPWPPFEGKAREIALRRVADLGGDAAAQERLARHCWETAREEWENRM